MTRALVTQLVDALESGLAYVENEANQLTTREYKAAIKAAREYLATEPRGERSELIQWLRGAHRVLGNENSKTIADMLETDAQPKQVTCQIYGHVVGACVECNTHIEAQQAKRVPLSDAAIWKSDAIMAANSGYGATFQSLRDVIKAVEAHHGITPADKPTDWSAA